MEPIATAEYPARLDVEYPDRALNRLTTFFRLLTVLPIFVILGLVMCTGGSTGGSGVEESRVGLPAGLWLATMLMILVRRKYPRWWFDWQLALARFGTRVETYLMLMRDEYPAVEEEQAVRLELDYPDAARDLNRWLPLVKWLLLLPHYVVLLAVSLASLACVVLAWFAILVTGRYPRGLFEFNVGVLRYWLRVWAYGFLLITDRYPPFALKR